MARHKKTNSSGNTHINFFSKTFLAMSFAIFGITGAYAVYDDAGMGGLVTSGNQFTSDMWNTTVANVRDIYGRTQYLNTSGANTGIGTATPTSKLTVNGAIKSLGGAGYAGVNGYSFTAPGDTDGGLFSPADGTVVIATNNTEKMRIDSSGNVGIGTTSPTHKLFVNGTARANSFIGGRITNESGGLRISNPDGGAFTTTSSTLTGAIKIKLPTPSYKSNTMLRFTVKIYEYNGGGNGTSRSIDIGGYNYSDAAANWINYFATQSTMGGSDINVRFGNDGTSQVVWIGETSTVWSYPQIFVTDFQGGYSNATDAIWGSGWNVSIQSAFNTVTQGPIIARKNLDGSSIAGTGNYVPKYTSSSVIGNSTIYDNGSVGIGTTTPRAKFDVNNGGIVSGDANGYGLFIPKPGTDPWSNYDRFEIRVDTASQNTFLGNVNGGTGSGRNLGLLAGNSERIRILGSNGNVGIGTLTPAYRLDVSGDVQANGWVRTLGAAGWYSQSYGGGWYMTDTTWIRGYGSKSLWMGTGHIGTDGGLTLGYGGTTPPNAGAIIAGNVGIGSSATPARRLEVTGDIGSTAGYYQRNTSPTIYLQDTDNRSAMIHNNSNLLYFLRGCGNDAVGWCQTGGYWPLYINLENNDAVFGGSVYSFNYFYNSDRRLKKNIQPLEGALMKILQLNGYTYEWKSNGRKSVGVIAQEVEKVFPELVGESKNANGETTKSVEYGNLVAPIIESIKELVSMHDKQEEKIEKLEKENAELKKQINAIQMQINNLGK